jgi:2-methylcitrate dehydratase PrpD
LRKGGIPEATLFRFRHQEIRPKARLFANAVSSHSLEMDDIDRLAMSIYSPPVFSAALAAAEMMDSTGKELCSRAGGRRREMMESASALRHEPGHRDRGFHTTPTCGIFGAAPSPARC